LPTFPNVFVCGAGVGVGWGPYFNHYFVWGKREREPPLRGRIEHIYIYIQT
jgi:hypothetical protein